MAALDVTTSLTSWKFQNTHIERQLDNAAYTAAHPDDTLVLAGPPRMSSASAGDKQTGTAEKTETPLMPLGMLQSMQFTQTKPTQPMMAIGSGRSFFVSGKAQTQWSIARLFVNGRNLLRVLYHNMMETQTGVDITKFDDPAGLTKGSKYVINLDSELFYVPMGLACLFRSKAHDWVGAFYVELCMINSYAVGINAGQNMILENVTGLADRILPYDLTAAGNVPSIPRATLDLMIGWAGKGDHSSKEEF